MTEHHTQPTPPQAAQGRPRTWPIVWGVLVLAFCAYTTVQLVAPGSVDSTTFAIATVIGIGLLLLVVGAAILARTQFRNRGTSSGGPGGSGSQGSPGA